MTVFIVTRIRKRAAKNLDCRCVTLIEAAEYKGNMRIVLSPQEAHDMVTRGRDRLWVSTRDGFIPVIPASRGGIEYVRTEPTDNTGDALILQPELNASD